MCSAWPNVVYVLRIESVSKGSALSPSTKIYYTKDIMTGYFGAPLIIFIAGYFLFELQMHHIERKIVYGTLKEIVDAIPPDCQEYMGAYPFCSVYDELRTPLLWRMEQLENRSVLYMAETIGLYLLQIGLIVVVFKIFFSLIAGVIYSNRNSISSFVKDNAFKVALSTITGSSGSDTSPVNLRTDDTGAKEADKSRIMTRPMKGPSLGHILN